MNTKSPGEIATADSVPETKKEKKERLLPKMHTYSQVGILHYDAGEEIANGFNRQLNIGLGYAYTFIQRKAFGPTVFLEPFLRFQKFNFSQSPDISPDSIQHFREWLKIFSFTGGFSNRFVFSMPKVYRKNPGAWAEPGIGFMFPFYSAWAVIEKNEGEGRILKTVWKGLHAAPVLFARLKFGYSFIGVFAEYRITDFFRKDSAFPNFPRLNFGITIEEAAD